MTKHEEALHLAVAALQNYANPSSYRGIAFVAEAPAGWFYLDFGSTEHTRRMMPGKLAREVLSKIDVLLNIKE